MSQKEVYDFLKKNTENFLSCSDIAKLAGLTLQQAQRGVRRLHHQNYLIRKPYRYNAFIYALREAEDDE
ncbi:MAG: hypothetical protein KAS07_05820 [Candidatus Pacebacteria bacterium]|nr:hypothetical protein [Candidatus Paceibacterota bacterium]